MSEAFIEKEHLNYLINVSKETDHSLTGLVNEYTLNAVNFSEGFNVTKEDYSLSYDLMKNKYKI